VGVNDRRRGLVPLVIAVMALVVALMAGTAVAGAQTTPSTEYVPPTSTTTSTTVIPPAGGNGGGTGAAPTNLIGPAAGGAAVLGVNEQAPEVEGATQEAPGRTGGGSGEGAGSDATQDEDLSFVSTGIPESIDLSPGFIVTNVGFGALLVLLLVGASQLFNDAMKMHHDRIVGHVVGRSSIIAGALAVFQRIPRIHPLVTFAVAAGTLGLLADPNVSLSYTTLGQILGMTLALGIIVAVYEIPAARAIERASGQHERFRLFPLAIAIAIGCLLFSRIFDVAPGVLYGLFAGVLFVGIDDKLAGRAYARSSVLLGSAAMLAWGLHRWLVGPASATSPSLWAIIFDTAAAVLFVGGLQSVIVQLLPMPFTYGESVIAWNKVVWGSLFVGGLALYMQFVVRPNPDNVTWSNLWFVGAFLVVALGFWGYCAYRRWSDGRNAPPPEGGTDESLSAAAGA